MEIREHHVPFHLPLAKAYVEDYRSVAGLYEYNPFHPESYHQRKSTLLEKKSPLRCSREALVEALRAYNIRIMNHANSLNNIERLLDPHAVVVIGGQQPGILTGPLYTIYKIITILQLAKREEARLGLPVIPVFWIAGEDHDWDEVNHVYAWKSDRTLHKKVLPTRVKGKRSLSHLPLHKEEIVQFIQELFEAEQLTEHSDGVRERIIALLDGCKNYSDFFARLLIALFGDEGLVLIDSADPIVRQLEGEMFAELIKENEAISRYFQEGCDAVVKLGYTPQVENNPISSFLFIYENGERLLLERADEQFRIRNGNKIWRREELIDLAMNNPELFSCNVVTRPLMQEFLFPVLAFVGGPGEISYWGLYRRIFRHFGMEMPIIVPRMTFTLVERHVQKLQEDYQLSFSDLIFHLEERKREWLDSQDNQNIKAGFDQVREEIAHLYRPLQAKLAEMNQGLARLSEQNLKRILDQVGYLETKANQAFAEKHQAVLKQFERAKQSLIPNEKPQERIYNLFTFINKYGWSWWEHFKRLTFDINHLHKEIRL